MENNHSTLPGHQRGALQEMSINNMLNRQSRVGIVSNSNMMAQQNFANQSYASGYFSNSNLAFQSKTLKTVRYNNVHNQSITQVRNGQQLRNGRRKSGGGAVQAAVQHMSQMELADEPLEEEDDVDMGSAHGSIHMKSVQIPVQSTQSIGQYGLQPRISKRTNFQGKETYHIQQNVASKPNTTKASGVGALSKKQLTIGALSKQQSVHSKSSTTNQQNGVTNSGNVTTRNSSQLKSQILFGAPTSQINFNSNTTQVVAQNRTSSQNSLGTRFANRRNTSSSSTNNMQFQASKIGAGLQYDVKSVADEHSGTNEETKLGTPYVSTQRKTQVRKLKISNENTQNLFGSGQNNLGRQLSSRNGNQYSNTENEGTRRLNQLPSIKKASDRMSIKNNEASRSSKGGIQGLLQSVSGPSLNHIDLEPAQNWFATPTNNNRKGHGFGETALITNEDLLRDFVMGGMPHPSRQISRAETTDVERQNINVRHDLSEDIDQYLRWLEKQNEITGALDRHKITPALRARMIDWMIEVLTNFRCDDQTFFLASSLMDRYFKNCPGPKEVGDLHVIGVTTMFLASKFEDIYPLKMKTVYEKIAHKKLEIERIKELELDIMKVIDYKIHAPTVLDFLKNYLLEVLGIEILGRTETKLKEERAIGSISQEQADDKTYQTEGDEKDKQMSDSRPKPEDKRTQQEKEHDIQQYLIEKMAIYLAKMSMHDMNLACKHPSLLAVGSIYVALKICEQLKRKDLINASVVTRLIQVSKMAEEQILDVSQKVLYLAQNFDKEFPGHENLKKTHFTIITQLL